MELTSSQSLSSLSSNLHRLTSVKLNELSRQKRRLDEHYDPILAQVRDATSEKERLSILAKSIATAETKNIRLQGNIQLDNLEDVIAQHDTDLSLGESVLSEHSNEIVQQIKEAGVTYQYSVLFGKIFNEWLKSDGLSDSSVDMDAVETESIGSSYVQTGRPEMYEQKAQLESIIFEPSTKADVKGFQDFMSALFAQELDERDVAPPESDISKEWDITSEYGRRKEVRTLLKVMRRKHKTFGRQLKSSTRLTNTEVELAINGLLALDLLSDQNKRTCKEMLLSSTIISEMASVLTMMLHNLDDWSWSEDGVDMTFRRQLNGKYRCFLEEEVLEAVFLQYVGMKWSVQIKQGFEQMMHIWLAPEPRLTMKQQMIRTIMIPDEDIVHSMDRLRESEFKKDFFMLVLPNRMNKTQQYEQQFDEWGEEATKKREKDASVGDLKQRILHRMLIEANIAKVTNVSNTYTAVHTDFEWFGPSLSHEILIAAMKFTGVPYDWCVFFSRFLKVPCRFSSDGQTNSRVRQRGVPISHSISTVLGENLLFYLDLAMNQATGKDVHYYRLHDDIWFYSHDLESCKTAYDVIQQFSEVTDLKLNTIKSGSVVMNKTAAAGQEQNCGPSPLPQKSLKWGFIELYSDYIFRINMEDVEIHIKEMSRQLQVQKSILGYINVYNRYMKFFIRNFGENSRIMGGQHLEQITNTIKHIHTQIFPDCNGDVLAKIKQIIRSHFPVDTPNSLLDAWIILPLSHGGLGLTNYALSLFPLKKSFDEIAQTQKENANTPVLEMCLKKDRTLYERHRDKWNNRSSYPDMSYHLTASDYEIEPISKQEITTEGTITIDGKTKRPKFLSFDDYVLGRASHSENWAEVWTNGVETPWPICPSSPVRIRREFTRLQSEGSLIQPLSSEWHTMSAYWQWVFVVYGPGLLNVFGRVDFMDANLIPLGMIDTLKSAKIKWDQ